ncbi:MAG: hypothetical protein FWE95_01445 [Planctomycetaceae bacterium]|nr:hypothetical protein [Planctomycetaceae bacterium]
MQKPWYKRRRYWTLAVVTALVYFCLIPMPLRISPETTGITSPLLPNGNVDYFGAFEQTYIHKLSPPEDNGLRLIIAALGPKALEQYALATSVPWEEMPTHEHSNWWFENRWIPLCEHMGIDPYAKPQYLDNHDFHSFLRDEWEANQEEGSDARYDSSGDEDLRRQLAAAPWRAKEHPNIARWLEERSPLLDLFGVAVRKPNFECYRWRPEGGGLSVVLLPDVQSQRQFARELQVRITERLEKGDIDGAWYDVMSMFYLSRKHYIHDPIYVINLVGVAVEGLGWEAAKLVLQHGNLTPEQLEQFAQDLEALPQRTTVDSEFELHMVYAGLQGVCVRDEETLKHFFSGSGCCGSGPTSWDKNMLQWITFVLPIDQNIAGKRITEYLQRAGRMPPDERERMHTDKCRQVESFWSLFRVPLMRTRSQLIADQVIAKMLFYPGNPAQKTLDHANARFDLFRIAVALERHKSAQGEYPTTLDELVPAYLEEVPIDPCTGSKTLTYKLAPDEATAFLLYSYGANETDDGGDETEDVVLRIMNVTIQNHNR